MQEFIPDICLLVMQFIGGSEALSLRCLSKSWLKASEYLTIHLHYYKNNETKLLEILNHSMMKHVSELCITSKLTRSGFRKLIEIPNLRCLKSLRFSNAFRNGGGLGTEYIDIGENYCLLDEIGLIAHSKVFSNLECLIIRHHDIGNGTIQNIFNSSSVLKNLKKLCLVENKFDNFGIASFNSHNTITNLRELSLVWESISIQDVELMKKNQIFKNLTKLELTGLEEEHFSLLISGNPIWSNLKELKMPETILQSLSVSNIKCTLQLEKLRIDFEDMDVCKALVSNKTISKSLKCLNIGLVRDITAQQEILQEISLQFEIFTYFDGQYIYIHEKSRKIIENYYYND